LPCFSKNWVHNWVHFRDGVFGHPTIVECPIGAPANDHEITFGQGKRYAKWIVATIDR
jgi:hypothetical protein